MNGENCNFMDAQQKIKYSLTQNHPLVKLFNWMRDRGLVQFASYEDYIARRNDPAPKPESNLAMIEAQVKNKIMKNLNQTIHKFEYQGVHYEVDWLTDATCVKGTKICDIFKVENGKSDCVGQIIVPDSLNKKQIEVEAINEILDQSNQ